MVCHYLQAEKHTERMDAETLLHRHVRLVETTEGQLPNERPRENGQEVANVESHDR